MLDEGRWDSSKDLRMTIAETNFAEHLVARCHLLAHSSFEQARLIHSPFKVDHSLYPHPHHGPISPPDPLDLSW